jgi:hypothetical protein
MHVAKGGKATTQGNIPSGVSMQKGNSQRNGKARLSRSGGVADWTEVYDTACPPKGGHFLTHLIFAIISD